MSAVWQTIVGTLICSAIGGITFIAYKHPRGYERMHAPLAWTVVGVLLLWITYSIGVTSGYHQAASKITENHPDIFVGTKPVSYAFLWSLVVAVSAIFYLGFLRFLPHILGQTEADKGRE